MRSAPPQAALLAAIAGSAMAFALYSYTAAPGLTLVDSAELALAASSGGVAHPPGFPLFLLVGRLFAAMPFADPARMLNLMSAFFMAATSGTILLSVERMLALSAPEESDAARRITAGAVAAAAFATAWNPWVWSAVTEVYALNVFLLGAAWACAWCGVAALRQGSARTVSAVAWRWIAGAAGLASLALANHHATGAVAFPVLVGMLAWARPGVLRSPRFWLIAVVSVVGALSLYLFLFIAARNDGALNWGRVDSFALLVRHVTGQQYALQVGSSGGEAWRVARVLFATMFAGVGILPAALVALGIGMGGRRLFDAGGRGGRRGRRGASRIDSLPLFAPLAMIGVNLALSMFYVAGPEDRMAYDLPATVAWCLLAGMGTWAVIGKVRASGLVAAVMALAVVAMNARHHFDICNLREERVAQRIVEETLRDVGPGGVVLTAEWNFYAPFLYMRAQGFRTDVRVINVLMLRRFWYMEYLEREYPELMAESRDLFAPFRAQVSRFDLGQPYDATTIQQNYDALILRWIALGTEAGGAFADGACYEHPQELGWLNGALSVPEGLLIRFLADDSDVANQPLAPYDDANLRYLRSRITNATVERDLTDLPERHHPYYRVWRSYQTAVEASLLIAARTGEAAFRGRATAYETWFPELDRAVAHALEMAQP